MKRIIYILLYSAYLVILLGFILHTSSHPQIFGKYTFKYLIFLILLIIGFIPFLRILNFFEQNTAFHFGEKKIILTQKRKILLILLLIIILITPIELFLRNKYKNYESSTYAYTLDNFNPFLQSQIAGQENLNINSLGFRGEEILADKPKGTYRIVVLGGSTVLNREVPFEDNAVRILEKKLRLYFPNRKIEVINAGKDYYTTEHSLIQYMFKISDLNPDLIIMWHGANDMWNSCLSEGVFTHGPYKSDYSHFFGPLTKIVFDYFRPQPLIQIKFVTLDFLLKASRDNLYSDITSKLKEFFLEKAIKNYINEKNTISVRDFPSDYAYRRNLSYLIEITKQRNVPLILGNQPNLFKTKNSTEEVKKINVICKKDNKNYDLESLKYGLDLFNRTTEQTALEKNTLFVNLDKEVPKNLTYFLDAFHYTKEGNKTVANNLFNFILSKRIIENSKNNE
jgi:lysophospholipase L1-like esterase